MAKVDKREKRRLARLARKQEEIKAKQEEVSADDDELDEEIEEEPELEPARKSYDVAVAPHMAPASVPVSFDELDKMKQMKEQAEAIREVSWDAQDLVHNILYYSELGPNEKAEAIKNVGEQFGARLQNAMTEEMMENSLDDVDLLSIKAMIATDERHTSLYERFTDFLSKAKLTYAAEQKLSDDDFALVYTDKDGNKVRKYPIHDKAHVRNALARAAQMIEKGGEAATDAKKALPKIRAAAKKMGIGEMEKSKSSVIVEKAADGRWRAVMFPSNNYIDWHGDIISEDAHREYVDWVNKNMDCAPVFMTWHIPGTARENPIDFAAYENGFLIMSAPLTESEAAGLLRAQAETDIGMSHTSVVLERDANDPRVVTKYRMVEVTDLPLDAAANPFTDFELSQKKQEADMAIDTRKYLATLLGSEEKADAFLKKTGLKQKELDEAQIPSKEKEAPEQEAPKTAEAPQALTLDQVIEAVSKQFGMEELSTAFAEIKEKAEKVDTLEQVVAELAKKDEEKLAEKIAPKAAVALSWMQARPSQSKDTVLSKDNAEDEKLKQSKPTGGWLSEVTGTTPIQ